MEKNQISGGTYCLIMVPAIVAGVLSGILAASVFAPDPRPIAEAIEQIERKFEDAEAGWREAQTEVIGLKKELEALRIQTHTAQTAASAALKKLEQASETENQQATATPNLKKPVNKLPPHVSSSAPRGRRSQIRAVISKNAHTKLEIELIAINLVNQNNLAPCLVQFFDNESCLRNWDGTGLLRDSDWPHWLGRAKVDKNWAGLLSASFKLAVGEQTGKSRTDVFRQ